MVKKIIIVNAHWNNRGDEAALRALVDRIILLFPDCKIKIMFKDSGEIAQFPYSSPKITYFCSKFLPHTADLFLQLLTGGRTGYSRDMRRTVLALKKADYLIYAPGGSVINDRFWWRKQLEYLLPCFCSILYHKPLFIAAPSIGPFSPEYRLRNLVRKRALEGAAAICVRDKFSSRYLKQLGVGRAVHLTADSAFLDQPDMERNRSLLESMPDLCGFLKKYPRVVGMTITDLSWHVVYGKDQNLRTGIKTAFTAFIEELGRQGTGVLLIPQLFGNQNDRNYLQAFVQDNVFLLGEQYDCYFQQYIISRMYALIGMRYHSNIFAAKMGVPFIAVIYEEKMRGFMESAGLTRYTLELGQLNFCRLNTIFQDLCSHYPSCRSRLLVRSGQWRQKAEKTSELLSAFLQNH